MAKRKSKKSTGTRSRTRKKGRTGPTWTESARWAGATKEVKGRTVAMKASEALNAGLTVPGWIDKKMSKEWKKYAAGAKPGSAEYKGAVALLKKNASRLKKKRKTRGSPWLAVKGRGPVRGKGKKVRGTRGRFTGKTALGKWKAGRGPTMTLKLRKGFSPTEAQVRRLIEGGFGGPTGTKGGKVKLNRGTKKRRRRAKTGSRRRATTKQKNPKRRRKAVAKNPKRRRKAVAKNAPKRRKKAASKRRKPAKRRRSAAKKNPGGFKLALRKNPKRRVRRNPGYVADLQSALMKPLQAPLWVTTAHILAGSGMTAATCAFLRRQRFVPYALKAGRGELVLDLVSTGLVYGAARMGERFLPSGKLTKNFANNVLIGGAVYTSVKALFMFMPGLARKLGIAPSANGAFAPSANGASAPSVMEGYPSYPGQYPGMGGGIESPDALVRGESLARQINPFVGGMGEAIPIEDLRGYPGGVGDWLNLSGSGGVGGMGDWVELNSSAGLVTAGWDPGTESF